ncbi:hypothetical protein ANAEL_04116 [Anaerolineales bacterium]|nr:hypothetical protein ANAEL_04116 [Anaerolineales bacterium]
MFGTTGLVILAIGLVVIIGFSFLVASGRNQR